MTPTPDLARLRANHFALESLPTTILVPAQPARFGPVTKPLAEAPLDGLTYVLAPAEEEFNAAADRLHALKKLRRLARKAGAIGTDRSVDVIARRS